MCGLPIPACGGDSSAAPQQQAHPRSPPALLPQDVTEEYNLGKVLGKGQFGTTRLASQKKEGGPTLYACKSISKRKLVHPDDIEDVRREIQIMHHLK